MAKSKSFAMFYRSAAARKLIAKQPTAYLLLSLIVQLADYRNGKARIGNCKDIGEKTTEQQYRTAKKILSEMGLVSFVGIPKKGTIATIISNEIFSIKNDNNGIINRNKNGNKNGNNNGNYNGLFEVENNESNGIGNGNDNRISNGNDNGQKTNVHNMGISFIPPLIPPAGEAGKPAKKERKRFVKPSVEEIKKYCDERKNGIDAQSFFDSYEAKGWKIGKSPMQDWKAAVRTWENRNKKNNPEPKANSKYRNAF